MRLALFLSLVSFGSCASVNKKVRVPDNDATLQDLLYRFIMQRTNNELQDANWYIPVRTIPLQATKLSVPMNGKLYTTYELTVSSARSSCKRNAVPFGNIKQCQIDKKYSNQQTCKVTLAWLERDYSSIEMEAYCTTQPLNLAFKGNGIST